MKRKVKEVDSTTITIGAGDHGIHDGDVLYINLPSRWKQNVGYLVIGFISGGILSWLIF